MGQKETACMQKHLKNENWCRGNVGFNINLILGISWLIQGLCRVSPAYLRDSAQITQSINFKAETFSKDRSETLEIYLK